MEHEQATLALADALDRLDAPGLFDGFPDGINHDAGHRQLLKRAVAALPRTSIADMQRRELIFAIRTAELPWLNAADGRLEFADRQTLERLAFLARRVCRRQLDLPGAQPGSNGRAPAEAAAGRPLGPAVARHPAHPLHGREKPR